jgi:hypothetical protein
MTTSRETRERLKAERTRLAVCGIEALSVRWDDLDALLADADRCETLERELVEVKYGEGVEHGLRIDAERELTASRAETAALRAQVARIGNLPISGDYVKQVRQIAASKPTPPAQPQPKETP